MQRSKMPEETGPYEAVLEFSTWYSAHWDRVVRMLTVYTGNPAVAEDLAADAFEKALARWGTSSMPDNPSAWVMTVALNLAKRRIRRSLTTVPIEPQHDPAMESVLPDPGIWALVQRLPRRKRQVVALRYGADLQENEVAAILGLSTGTVSALLSSARLSLREHIRSEPDHDD